jgi:hypothetical protein
LVTTITSARQLPLKGSRRLPAGNTYVLAAADDYNQTIKHLNPALPRGAERHHQVK